MDDLYIMLGLGALLPETLLGFEAAATKCHIIGSIARIWAFRRSASTPEKIKALKYKGLECANSIRSFVVYAP
jgi:hypothetical protein